MLILPGGECSSFLVLSVDPSWWRVFILTGGECLSFQPLYRQLADIVVDTDGRKVGDVADEIRRRLDPEARP